MTTSFKSMRATLVVLSAVSCVGLSQMFTDTSSAASKNFAAQCERIMGNNVKALAIEPSYSNQQICACARTNQEFRRQLSATGIKCNESAITNFNQAVATPPDSEPPGEPPTQPALKGNNGWGNGGEGINNGSDNGTEAQSGPKSADADGNGQR